MLSFIKRRLSYANVALTAALVFAMAGGAFAAGASHKGHHAKGKGKSHYVITSTKQISPAVLHKLKGAAGPAGKEGAAGKDGAPGAAGKAGTAGQNGLQGEKGERGEKGEEGEAGERGEKGERGEEGEAGEPWTPNGTLPSKATETGAWNYTVSPHTSEMQWVPISFPIPLAAALDSEHVKIIRFEKGLGESESGPVEEGLCPGNAKDPKAAPGYLCVYVGYEYNSGTQSGQLESIISPLTQGVRNYETALGSSTTGALLGMFYKVEGTQEMSGSWAVTGS